MLMASQLNTAASTGTQSSTETPQTANQPSLYNITSGNVQSGTSQALLSGGSGVLLKPVPLSTVKLPKLTATTTQAEPKALSKHHVNGVLFGVVGGLFLLAIIALYLVFRSANNTTD